MGSPTKSRTAAPQSLRERVFAIMDGYEQTRALLAAARNSRRIPDMPPSVADAADAVREQIDALVERGESIPWDVARPIAVAQADQELLILRLNQINGIIHASQLRLEELPRINMSSALQIVRDELDSCITTAKRHIDNLDGARSPAQVLARATDSVREAWSSLTELTHTYDEIRTVQRDLIKAAGREHAMDAFLATGLYRNALDVSPHWLNRRREAAAASLGDLQGENVHIAWLNAARDYVPAVNSETSWWPDGDRTTSLITIIDITEPWVPDVDEMMDAFAAGRKATNPVRPQPRFSAAIAADGEHIQALENYRRATVGDAPIKPADTDLTTHNAITKKLESRLKVEQTAAVIHQAYREEREASARARMG